MKIDLRLSTLAVFAAAVCIAVPVSAQSTGPKHAGFDPNATQEGHFHEGEIGDKLLVLESGLKCDCGCGLDVHSCQFQMQCGTSPAWSLRIRRALEQGETVEAIEASFVADFGKTVLMAPPPEGFNLLGYLLPAMAIMSAGMLVGLLARGNGIKATAATANVRVTDEDEARLRAALERIDREEGPDW